MIVAILQARVSSTRLPGKVLRPILGKPMLYRQIERIQRAGKFDKLLVATSSHKEDDGIEELCKELNIQCFRGSLEDVLDRFYQAARPFSPEHVIRLTGDCPLTDPGILDQLVDFHLSGGYDYSSNALEATYPDGLDVEIMRFAALEKAWTDANLLSNREHVTLYMYSHPEKFRIGIMKNTSDLSNLRWTVDEAADLEFVTRVYESLYTDNSCFSTQDILKLLEEHPEITAVNHGFTRNEGLKKSLLKECK